MLKLQTRASVWSLSMSLLRRLSHRLLIISAVLSISVSAAAKKSTASADDSASAASPPASKITSTPGKSTLFFLNLGIRHDLGTFTQKETVGRASVVDDTTDIYAFGPLMQLGLLFPVANRLRVGGAFGYGFNYALTERQPGPNEGEPERTQLGQLLTVDLRAEWNPHLGGPVSLILAPIATLTMIAAGGDLKDITNSLAESHNVWKGPRLGWAAGAEAGVRYMITPWFSLKLAGGYAYTMQSVLHATRQGDAADSKRVWRVGASRITGLLGAEAHF